MQNSLVNSRSVIVCERQKMTVAGISYREETIADEAPPTVSPAVGRCFACSRNSATYPWVVRCPSDLTLHEREERHLS